MKPVVPRVSPGADLFIHLDRALTQLWAKSLWRQSPLQMHWSCHPETQAPRRFSRSFHTGFLQAPRTPSAPITPTSIPLPLFSIPTPIPMQVVQIPLSGNSPRRLCRFKKLNLKIMFTVIVTMSESVCIWKRQHNGRNSGCLRSGWLFSIWKRLSVVVSVLGRLPRRCSGKESTC